MLHRFVPLTLLLSIGCDAQTLDTPVTTPDIESACDGLQAIGHSEASHTKGADLAYDKIFDDNRVRRVDIVICPSDFEAMQQEVEALYEGGGGRPGEVTDDPSYVPVQVVYEGKSWAMVGMRYKGNSSLRDAVRSGNGKRPFRLNFDKYEDDYTEVDNQRFWGFKELKFGSAFKDSSLIRDKLASDSFRDAGIAAAKGTFVRVHVDVGDGPVYWGVYTMFEDPTNSLLDDWFGDDDGNCYKPEGRGATLSTYDQASMAKCSNEDEADYGDVIALVDVLNDAPERGEVWRAGLRDAMEIDGFMQTFAMHTLLSNWDAYGVANHNYYLYADPSNEDRLTYIPWDFNEAYTSDGPRQPLSITLDEVGSDWPLIRNTMDDPELSGVYYTALADHLDGAFAVDTQTERAQAYHDLIAPWAVGADGEQPGYTYLESEQAFGNSVADIIDQVRASRTAAESALGAR